ncbi:K+/H+ antiporter [Agaricicola taiwanensis]|uniref:K+/H+ antiporter n=2 Tax=Agaricicola taiwanensis TaxID=591372 RepID=A0A8J3DTS4_9RHOB|nr:K+/H+ antiporter [Agaricicola taiwanensis]
MQNIMFANAAILFGAALVLMGVISSLVAQRFGTPLLLVFLVIGMLVGVDGIGGIAFDNYALTYLVGSLALAIILFDGGLRTRLDKFRGVLLPAMSLATVGVVITTALTGLFAALVLSLSVLEGFLVGAMVASTDAAAVFFLLRSGGLQLRNRLQAILEIESGTNDPVAVFLTILLIELILAQGHETGLETALLLLRQGALGGAIGLGGGWLITIMLNRVSLPTGMHPLFVVASAVAIYGLTAVMDGSGLLAVYLAGLVVGNRPVRALPAIISFHDTVTWLCQIVMFIMLGLLITPSSLLPDLGLSLVIAVFLMFVGRPLAVAACLAPLGYSRREIAFVGWVGLRGAVSIFLAAIPTLAGVPNSGIYFHVAFVVVCISLICQGWTLNPLARMLELARPGVRPEVSRVEIDLPGQHAQEMVAYPVEADSPVAVRAALPKWAQRVFVIRDDTIIDTAKAGPLRPGDYGYFLVPPERVRELDRLFIARAADHEVSGARFPIRPDAPLGGVTSIYGVELPEEFGDRTVAEAFTQQFEGEPGVGDSFEIGPLRLTITDMHEGRISEAELSLGEESGAEVGLPTWNERIGGWMTSAWQQIRGLAEEASDRLRRR